MITSHQVEFQILFNMRYLLFLFLLVEGMDANSQESKDSGTFLQLPIITIESVFQPRELVQLEPIHHNMICSGIKNEVICLQYKDIALSEKYGRQIFSKVPGVFVYDMDGTGNQINISVRGLDPHRGWEFNIRKDFVLTNSDMYGYPASHYNIPMEAVDRIELIRGTGAVQYGAQFGGMLNYISKSPDSIKHFSYEGIQTLGSYDLISSFHRVSGSFDKWKYQAWANKKWNGGYRDQSDSEYDAQAISLYYLPNQRTELKLEWTHSNYIIHLAGPLNDSMFHSNPKLAIRSRNYYNPDIHVPSVSFNYKLSDQTQFSFVTSAVKGSRNSVMFDKPSNVLDTISLLTLDYANRQVDIDKFNSHTIEARLLHHYRLFGIHNHWLVGIQYMNNDLFRRQQGKGTTGFDFDLGIEKDSWVRSLHFKTENIAVFASHYWQLSSRLSLLAGMRYESGQSNMTGTIRYYADSLLPNSIEHEFPLFAINSEFQILDQVNWYTGWSQAYRPVIFKDIIPASVYETVDQALKDADGFNFETGFRGMAGNFRYDVNYFLLRYNHKLGTIAETNQQGDLTIHRTNIGDAETQGIECSLQWDHTFTRNFVVSLSNATSFMKAIYKNAVVRSGNSNISINGNVVESVPEWIVRNGLSMKWRKWSFGLLHSFTSSSFADALNSEFPNSTGTIGLVPEYHLLDANIGVVVSKNLKITLNVNNALDKSYFTKRPQFYPGPGIWPSDGRTWSCTVRVAM